MKNNLINKIEKAIEPFKPIFAIGSPSSVLMEIFARNLIAVCVLYIIGTQATSLQTYQSVLISIIMIYWVFLPAAKFFKEAFQ